MDWKIAYQKFQSLNNNVFCYCKMPYDKFELINLEFAELFTLIKEAAQQSVQLTALRRGLAVSIFINVILLAVVSFTIGGN